MAKRQQKEIVEPMHVSVIRFTTFEDKKKVDDYYIVNIANPRRHPLSVVTLRLEKEELSRLAVQIGKVFMEE